MRVLFHSSKGGAQQPLGILHKWSLGQGNRGLRLPTVLQCPHLALAGYMRKEASQS